MNQKKTTILKTIGISLILLSSLSFAQSASPTVTDEDIQQLSIVQTNGFRDFFKGLSTQKIDTEGLEAAITYLKETDVEHKPELYQKALTYAVGRLLQIRKGQHYKRLPLGMKNDLDLPKKFSSILSSIVKFLEAPNSKSLIDEPKTLQMLDQVVELMNFPDLNYVGNVVSKGEPNFKFRTIFLETVKRDKDWAVNSLLSLLEVRGTTFIADLDLAAFALSPEIYKDTRISGLIDDFLFDLSNASYVTDAEMKLVYHLGSLPMMVKLRGYIILDITKNFFLVRESRNRPSSEYHGQSYGFVDTKDFGIMSAVALLTHDNFSTGDSQLRHNAQEFLFNTMLSDANRSTARLQATRYFGYRLFKSVSKEAIEANIAYYDSMLLKNPWPDKYDLMDRDVQKLALDSRVYSLPSFYKLVLKAFKLVVKNVSPEDTEYAKKMMLDLILQKPILENTQHILYLLNEIYAARLNGVSAEYGKYSQHSQYTEIAKAILSHPHLVNHEGLKEMARPFGEVNFSNLIAAGAFRRFRDDKLSTELLRYRFSKKSCSSFL